MTILIDSSKRVVVQGMTGREGMARLLGDLIPLVASGTLRADVDAAYPLERALEALAHAARGGRSGKILLTSSS